VGTWEPHDPAFSRLIAAPLERCAELLGVDLAAIQRAAADVEPYISESTARRSGASCSLSVGFALTHTGGFEAAT
jgi:hypothetical protein